MWGGGGNIFVVWNQQSVEKGYKQNILKIYLLFLIVCKKEGELFQIMGDRELQGLKTLGSMGLLLPGRDPIARNVNHKLR